MTAPSNIATWPMQADYAERGDWRGLAKYNQKGSAGKTSKPKAAPAAAAPLGQARRFHPAHGRRSPHRHRCSPRAVSPPSAALQHMSSEELREIITSGGALPPSSLDSWPMQASYAAKGDWNGLADYNKRHHA